MKKLLIIFLLLITIPVNASSIVMDIDSKRILYEDNKDDQRLIASITKIMTAIITIENNPDLKANANYMRLQEELSNTESKIAYSRESYNNVTTAYNTKLEIFPNNIIAGMFNFKSEELFKVDNEEAKQNVKVSF